MSARKTYQSAGYQLGPVREHFLREGDESEWDDLFEQVCTFSVEASCPLTAKPEADPILAVAENIVSRGRPTLPSCDLEERMASDLGRTKFDDSKRAEQTGAYRYVPTDSFEEENFQEALQRAYALVEPRAGEENLQDSYESWEDHDSSAERRFHLQAFPNEVGAAGAQLLEPQRQVEIGRAHV